MTLGMMWVKPRGARLYLDQLGITSALTWDSTFDGGPADASVQMDWPGGKADVGLQAGVRCGISVGGKDVWTGVLNSPASVERTHLTATGDGALPAWFAAYSPTLDNAYNLNDVIDRAVTRGAPFSRRGVSLPSITGATAPSASLMISDALDFVARGLNRHWQIWDGRLSFTAGPSNGEAYTIVSVNDPDGQTLDGYASALFAAYYDSSTVARAVVSRTATRPLTVKEGIVDFTADGQFTATQMGGVAASNLARLSRLANFTGSFTVTPGQLLSTAGADADLATVRAGFSARIHGTDPFRGGQATTDTTITIGRVSYDQDAQVLTCTPMDAHERDLVNTLAKAAA